jgi:hypothetical protein
MKNMSRSRELLGLIAGFAAGTLLGAIFMSTGKIKTEKQKDDKAKNKEEYTKTIIHEN